MGRPKKNQNANTLQVKKVNSLPGFHDILTETDLLWQAVNMRLLKQVKTYGFAKVDLPFLEDLGLFSNFFLGKQSELAKIATLNSEGKTVCVSSTPLPSVLRAYTQHKIYDKQPQSKWYYTSRNIKIDPKTLKLAEEYVYGMEVFGIFNHLTEAQTIACVWDTLLSLGVPQENLSLEINHLGHEECQVAYQGSLTEFLQNKKYQLCDSCADHLKERPLNIFRCSNIDCQSVVAEAPTILDFLDEQSHKHFTSILEALDEVGVPYNLSPLYAGPEGHGKTNFIIRYKNKNTSLVLGEGGYHEQLMKQVFGKPLCCFGFAGNFDVLKEALLEEKIEFSQSQKSEVFLVPLGDLAAKKTLKLFRELVLAKISVHDLFGHTGVKNQLKNAENQKAPIALIIGQKEAMDDVVILRDVKSGMQEVISYDKIIDEVKKRLGR